MEQRIVITLHIICGLLGIFCESIHIVPVCDVAHQYAIEKVKLRKKGKPIDDFDLLIAATAIHEDCVLVTENIRHMDRFENLRVENWVNR